MQRIDFISAAFLLLMPLPAVWGQWSFYQASAVFRSRVATPTPSGSPIWYLLGLGLLVPLAIIGWRRLSARPETRTAALFLAAWAVVGLILPYAPVSFQRKLAMGMNIPWAILAGPALSALAGHVSGRFNLRWGAALAVGTLCCSLTIVRWFDTALTNIETNSCEAMARLFLSPDEAAAIRWLSENAGGRAVLAMPLQAGGVSGYLPGFAGVSTYAGHWGETPDWLRKFSETRRFYTAAMTDEARRALLKRADIRYVFWSAAERMAGARRQNPGSIPASADLAQMAGLRAVFRSGSGEDAVTVFRVE